MNRSRPNVAGTFGAAAIDTLVATAAVLLLGFARGADEPPASGAT